MSIEMVSLVLGARIRPASHKLVAVCLAERCGVKTGTAFVGHADTAARACLTIGQVKRVMRDLRRQGIVLVLNGHQGGRPGWVPTYGFDVQKLRELTPESAERGGAQVIPLSSAKSGDGGRGCTDGGHTRPPTGGVYAPQTGIEPGEEPKDAHAHESASESAPVATDAAGNSRQQSETDGAQAARERLRALARSLGKGVRHA